MDTQRQAEDRSPTSPIRALASILEEQPVIKAIIKETSSTTPTTPVAGATIASGRCRCSGCRGKVAVIVGHCNYCTLDYCLKHRLPEVHDCEMQNQIKAVAAEANKQALMTGKTTDHRGLDRI